MIFGDEGYGMGENTKFHPIDTDDLWEIWSTLSAEERVEWFGQLDTVDAEDFFSSIPCDLLMQSFCLKWKKQSFQLAHHSHHIRQTEKLSLI